MRTSSEDGSNEAGTNETVCPCDATEAKPDNHADKSILSAADIRHNMIVLIMLDAIFGMGATDLQIAIGPLWKYLQASNTVIGLVGSLQMTAIFGVVVSPFISLRFRIKKWYLLLTHIPYLAAWGLIGLALLFSKNLGFTDSTLLTIVVVLMGANYFLGGFVTLPHQEYTAACIPMSHRGRFSGYSQGFGAAASLISSAIGYVILRQISKPMAFGYLFLMTWFICQSGYLLALFGREQPTPVEKAPRPWSKKMLQAAWEDKPFLKVMILYCISMIIFASIFSTFIIQYGLRETGMIDASAASIAIIMQLGKILLSGPIGHITDKFSPKRMVPVWPIFACLTILPVLLLRNQLGVYASMAMSGVFAVGSYAAFCALLYGLPKPENRAGHFTIQILATYVSASVGPVIAGAMCDKLSYIVTFAIVAAAGLVLAMVSKAMLTGISTDAEAYS